MILAVRKPLQKGLRKNCTRPEAVVTYQISNNLPRFNAIR